MRGAVLVAALLLSSSTARAEKRITIEKATVPWSELERLLSKEGAAPERPAPDAPRSFAISSAELTGTISGDRARLSISLGVEVLATRWTVVPLLPASLAVAHARLEGPRRHLLARDGSGVSLVAQGAGHYTVELEVEGPLEHGSHGGRLALPLSGLTGGTAHLVLKDAGEAGGRTAWHREILPDGSLALDATLGEGGVDLLLPDARPATEAEGALEELDARTVLSLGGGGVTRVVLRATPGRSGALELQLPADARLWKVYVDGSALEPGPLARGSQVRIPLRTAARVELAYTFSVAPMGIRGRYHVELPRWSAPVRGATWQLYLPEGLRYTETQASLAVDTTCLNPATRSRIPLQGQGECVSMARPVLEGAGYVEGSYAQPL